MQYVSLESLIFNYLVIDGNYCRTNPSITKKHFKWGSRLEQKTPVTECLVCYICVLISMEKSMLRICSVFISVPITFHSLHQVWQRFPLVSALELCCCRVIPLANQELTFYERISCPCGMDFQKPRLGEYTAPLSLCLHQYPPEALHCARTW